MNMLTEREIINLVDACGKRVCTTDQHHDCPYGDDGCTDCVDRLEADYQEAIQKLLALRDSVAGDCTYCQHNDPENISNGPCKGCVHFAAKEFIEGDYWELAEVKSV